MLKKYTTKRKGKERKWKMNGKCSIHIVVGDKAAPQTKKAVLRVAVLAIDDTSTRSRNASYARTNKHVKR